MISDTLNALVCFENAKNYGSSCIDGYWGQALVYYYQKEYNKSLFIIKEYEQNIGSIKGPGRKSMKDLKEDIEKILK